MSPQVTTPLNSKCPISGGEGEEEGEGEGEGAVHIRR